MFVSWGLHVNTEVYGNWVMEILYLKKKKNLKENQRSE